MNRLAQEVIYGILVAVIFLAVYSIWLNPSVVSETYGEVKNFVSGSVVKLPGDQELITGNDVQGSSIISCLNQIEEKSRMFKEKSPLGFDIDIREYREFDNSDDAIDYLIQWGYAKKEICNEEGCFPNRENTLHFPDFFKYNFDLTGWTEIIQYDDIVVVLTRFETYLDGNQVSELVPMVCIGGELNNRSLGTLGF